MEPLIMVVDDAAFMRRLIKKALAEGGYQNIVEVENGQEVLEKYRECRPNLVLLDITLPGRTGLEALEDVLAADENAKVIMCSAIGQEAIIAQAILKGAQDFIIKPFRPEELLCLVKAYLV